MQALAKIDHWSSGVLNSKKVRNALGGALRSWKESDVYRLRDHPVSVESLIEVLRSLNIKVDLCKLRPVLHPISETLGTWFYCDWKDLGNGNREKGHLETRAFAEIIDMHDGEELKVAYCGVSLRAVVQTAQYML